MLLNINEKRKDDEYPLCLVMNLNNLKATRMLIWYAQRNDIIMTLNKKKKKKKKEPRNYPLLLTMNHNNI